ncbi:arylamine N-acetyltransferase [Salsuginibacillus kocurii]|uniref:arylamine N-acetyltransferase n=1 Tax=Salsuginibacillus kocurii TaxID=427078 RepID=UPI000379A765|nr:arylamine N-acetyltransferase [Salsuginibacillus kocurii]
MSWKTEYLQILQLNEEPPSLSYLRTLIRRHIFTFPFENLTKLVHRDEHRWIDPAFAHPSLFLRRYKKLHGGGTCYTLNSNFFMLLRELGFSGHLLRPGDGHMAMIIWHPSKEQQPLYVDVGTMAPFFGPVLFNGSRRLIPSFAGEQVLFLPVNGQGRYVYLKVHGNKVMERKWEFSLYDSQSLESFLPYLKASYSDSSSFMQQIRCHRWFPEERKGYLLLNDTFINRSGKGTRLERKLRGTRDIKRCLLHDMKFPFLVSLVDEAVDSLAARDIDYKAK